MSNFMINTIVTETTTKSTNFRFQWSQSLHNHLTKSSRLGRVLRDHNSNTKLYPWWENFSNPLHPTCLVTRRQPMASWRGQLHCHTQVASHKGGAQTSLLPAKQSFPAPFPLAPCLAGPLPSSTGRWRPVEVGGCTDRGGTGEPGHRNTTKADGLDSR